MNFHGIEENVISKRSFQNKNQTHSFLPNSRIQAVLTKRVKARQNLWVLVRLVADSTLKFIMISDFVHRHRTHGVNFVGILHQ